MSGASAAADAPTKMTDWREIQARIRKAKVGADAPAKLAELFERTRDAMVAFELASVHEKAGERDEAVRWYATAVERFRRAAWKQKAADALTRLGAPVPAQQVAAPETAVTPAPEISEPVVEQEPLAPSSAAGEGSGAVAGRGAVPAGVQEKRARRGRRGGRRHRRKVPVQAQTARPAVQSDSAPMAAELPATPILAEREEEMARISQMEAEAPPAAVWQGRARTGDPALASRAAHLESQLRRLIAAPMYGLAEADQAPAGPGVYLLSDADQSTYYHVEACRTLRIALGLLVRSERGSRGGGEAALRGKLSKHLGISEARATKYLKEHCAVRWLQLDEGASHLAHFAIAVLRPPLNE